MKKIRLTPTQRDIVWVLEEAGEENLACILNTLLSDAEPQDREALLTGVSEALEGLIRMGYVEVKGEVKNLTEAHFGSRGVQVEILLTQRGREQLTT